MSFVPSCPPCRFKLLARFWRLVLAGALYVEALYTAFWFTTRLQTLFFYDYLTIALTFARAGVAVLQFSAASQLAGRRPAARPLTRAALLAGAMMFTLEIGFGLASTTILPSQRWRFVAGYWVLVGIGWWILRDQNRYEAATDMTTNV